MITLSAGFHGLVPVVLFVMLTCYTLITHSLSIYAAYTKDFFASNAMGIYAVALGAEAQKTFSD